MAGKDLRTRIKDFRFYETVKPTLGSQAQILKDKTKEALKKASEEIGNILLG